MDSAGWILVDTPTRGKKETLDKKIIVDVMQTALTSELSCVIVLISSDGDFAYMLNRLRDQRFKVLIIHKALVGQCGNTPACLYNSSDIELSWSTVMDTSMSVRDSLSEKITDKKTPAKQESPERGQRDELLDPHEGDFDAIWATPGHLRQPWPELYSTSLE
jgi:hypothetical protein